MKENTKKMLDDFFENQFHLQVCEKDIKEAIFLLCNCFKKGKKIMVCGNGGSAADSDHIVGELMKGFCKTRKLKSEDISKLEFDNFTKDEKNYIISNLQGALPAISLVSHAAFMTAYGNDVKADLAFAQQVYGYGKPGDILIGLSTSGNSENVIYAIKIARSLGMKTISFTGEKESALLKNSDVTLRAPKSETYQVQEEHIKIYHMLCLAIENEFFEE